MCRSSGQ